MGGVTTLSGQILAVGYPSCFPRLSPLTTVPITDTGRPKNFFAPVSFPPVINFRIRELPIFFPPPFTGNTVLTLNPYFRPASRKYSIVPLRLLPKRKSAPTKISFG